MSKPFDDIATATYHVTGASGVALIVMDDRGGTGVSILAHDKAMAHELAGALEELAADLRADLKESAH